MKFKGHITRAIDGTSFFTPRTPELLKHFSERKTKSKEKTHYPYELCVTAVNVFTNQPVAAVVDDYKKSERELLIRLMAKFNKHDLSLLDRGLGGKHVYFEFNKTQQFFIHRTKTSGEKVASYVRGFLESKLPETKIKIELKCESSAEIKEMQIRLIRGPRDSEGKPIVFVTNLLNRNKYDRKSVIKLYRRRWGVETLYNRMKNLLNLEQFRAKNYNGIMQEIFGNLLILSLTAAAVSCVVQMEKGRPKGKVLRIFGNKWTGYPIAFFEKMQKKFEAGSKIKIFGSLNFRRL